MLMILHLKEGIVKMLESRDASGLTGALSLEFDTVSKLAGIALQNIYTVYPNKLNQVLCSADDLKPPQESIFLKEPQQKNLNEHILTKTFAFQLILK